MRRFEGDWKAVLQRFREIVSANDLSLRDVASATNVSYGTVRRLLEGEVSSPHPSTKRAIAGWVVFADRPGSGIHTPGTLVTNETAGGLQEEEIEGRIVSAAPPEEELLEYFLENFEQMATFMATTTEDLNPTDRRKVALAILNGFKKLLIEAGEPIPSKLRELESRFVDDADNENA